MMVSRHNLDGTLSLHNHVTLWDFGGKNLSCFIVASFFLSLSSWIRVLNEQKIIMQHLETEECAHIANSMHT